MRHLIIFIMIGITACAARVNTKNGKPKIIDQLKGGKDIIIKGETITDRLDLLSLLSSVPINDKSSFIHVHSNIYFQDCTFEKEIISSKRTDIGGEVATKFYGSVAFINCKFKQEVDFRSAVFRGAVDFSNSSFSLGSNFQDALFMQRATFNGCYWGGEGKFQQSRYYHTTSFMDSRAVAHMLFQGAVFHDDCNFNVSNFSKYVDFSIVRFGGKSSFNYVNWQDRAVLTNSTWRDNVSFVNGTFGSISFKGSRCEGEFILQEEKISGVYHPMK